MVVQVIIVRVISWCYTVAMLTTLEIFSCAQELNFSKSIIECASSHAVNDAKRLIARPGGHPGRDGGNCLCSLVSWPAPALSFMMRCLLCRLVLAWVHYVWICLCLCIVEKVCSDCRQKFHHVCNKYELLASKVPKDQYYRLVSNRFKLGILCSIF